MKKDAADKKQGRKYLAASEKMAIVRRHLGPKRESVADLAAEHGTQPGSIYLWVQRLLDNGDLALEGKPRGETQAAKECGKKLQAMSERLAKKDRIIAELSTEYLAVSISRRNTYGDFLACHLLARGRDEDAWATQGDAAQWNG